MPRDVAGCMERAMSGEVFKQAELPQQHYSPLLLSSYMYIRRIGETQRKATNGIKHNRHCKCALPLEAIFTVVSRLKAPDLEKMAPKLVFVLPIVLLGWAFQAILRPPPTKLLAGAALVVPVINYWWPSFPAELSRQAFKKKVVPEQRTLWIAHNVPSLLYLWMTQKWLPSSAAALHHPEIFSKHDMEVLQKMMAMPRTMENKSRQQGTYESIHRDLLVAFGRWEFDPMNITNPFPQNEGSVHIWQGYKDRLVLVELQRYISKKLPWIKYHEVPEGGHMFMLVDGWTDRILKALLVGEEPSAV
ncbi:uncharacterized protein C2845_PM05G05400 [Panicum miliaceum]|uniref:Alpha/beta-Hydrolases superfamily protein n=1 Tax=Panicum miliaceum TaxID=4540 RepID=A0A3L6T184_PANMI|nr:uncharacterized protein C2845_PM05G05400 [Panicum miliaceum]